MTTVNTAQVLERDGQGLARYIFEGRGLVKRFGHVTALDQADFELFEGEVLAVVGDNGAGKSTMIKVLSGAVLPDAGVLLVEGRPVVFRGPTDAREHGVETIYQDLALAPALDIAMNLFLGREVRRKGVMGSLLRRLDKPAMRAAAQEALEQLGITTAKSVRQPVETLSGGQRQAVAVARAAAWGQRVVIMDEPIAALGVRESHQVLELVRRLRDHGVATVLISHNLPQVFEIADRIHVHRLGRRAALLRPEETSMPEVVAIMTGAAPGNEPIPPAADRLAEVSDGSRVVSAGGALTRAAPGPVRVRRSDMGILLDRARRLVVPGRRCILGITGAPAAGKSTLAEELVAELGPDAVLVPMDGFHLADAELKRLGTHDRKGALDTFDASGFVSLLRRLKDQTSSVVYAPLFRRDLEESLAGAVPVASEIPLVITEGNYLLAEEGEWRQVRLLLDEVWYLAPDDVTRVARLVERHMAFGRDRQEATERALGTDQRNAELVQGSSSRADVVIVGDR